MNTVEANGATTGSADAAGPHQGRSYVCRCRRRAEADHRAHTRFTRDSSDPTEADRRREPRCAGASARRSGGCEAVTDAASDIGRADGRTSAGLDLGYQGATSLHVMRVAVGAMGYPGADSGTTFSQEAELVSQFNFPRAIVELGATGSHSDLNDLQPLLETNISSSPQPIPVVPSFSDRVGPDEDLVPLGTVAYMGGTAAEAVSFAAHARYLKVRERTSYAFAVVSAAAALRVEHDRITQARLALGGVAAKPWRAREAELIMAGARAEVSVFQRAADAALAQAKPSGDNGFKIELARRIVVRALALAAAGTPERAPALPASPFAAVSGDVIHA